MAIFKSIITDIGNEMLTSILALDKNILITRVVIGDGISMRTNKQLVTEVVSPVSVNTELSGKFFEEGLDGDPSILRVDVQTTNLGLTTDVFIREIALYATDGVDEVIFCYSWLLDGIDTDNMLPIPINPSFADTITKHAIGIFVTSAENMKIEVAFSLGAFTTNQTVTDIIREISNEIIIEVGKIIGDIDLSKLALEATSQLIKSEIGNRLDIKGSTDSNNLFSWIKDINFLAKNIYQSVKNDGSTRVVYDTPGSFTFAIPDGITRIWITAISGGGAGGSGGEEGGGGGGAGGTGVLSQLITVNPTSTISVIVGKGGLPNDDSIGNTGGATIVHNYSFPGGEGGQIAGLTDKFSRGGVAGIGGANGGMGLSKYWSAIEPIESNGQNNLIFGGHGGLSLPSILWVTSNLRAGGGGGGGIGAGGQSHMGVKRYNNGNGGIGAGGSGGGNFGAGIDESGGNGGDGYVVIAY